MPTIKPKQINIEDLKCSNCGATSAFTIKSYGLPTKWESVVHGIEVTCKYCHNQWEATEDEYKF